MIRPVEDYKIGNILRTNSGAYLVVLSSLGTFTAKGHEEIRMLILPSRNADGTMPEPFENTFDLKELSTAKIIY